MGFLRCSYRLFRLSLHIIWGLLLVVTVFRHAENKALTPRQIHTQHRWLTKAGRIVGLRVTTHGIPIDAPALVAANHISWLDIMAIGSALPVSFLSKSEVGRWAVVGTLSSATGTLFIKRGGKNAAAEAIEIMRDRLQHGMNVVLFAEGTTSTGETVQRFHPRLFTAAVEANVPVQPLAVVYPHPQGVHPIAPFIDDNDLLTHGLKVLSEPSIPVNIYFCEPITDTQTERRTLADTAHQSVKQTVEQHQLPGPEEG